MTNVYTCDDATSLLMITFYCGKSLYQKVTAGAFCPFAPQMLCYSFCWREGAWKGPFVSIFRFPHAAEHGSVWIQRQNRLPAQARCSASWRQEVRSILWQDWHSCGEHTDYTSIFTSNLLVCPFHLTVVFVYISVLTKFRSQTGENSDLWKGKFTSFMVCRKNYAQTKLLLF